MNNYYLGIYTSTGQDRVKGHWKETKDEVDVETNSHLYKNQLQMRRIEVASIPQDTVKQLAVEHNCSVGEILSYVKI